MSTIERPAIELPGIKIEVIDIVLEGDSPLICHRWSEKAKKAMLDKQMKVAKQGKEAKDPDADYRESLYPYDHAAGDYGFPSVAFKAAAVGACRHLDMKMTEARGAFHVIGELCPIVGEPRMREDMVRVGNGVADIRYRGEFPDWKAYLTIKFNTSTLSIEQVLNLFNVGGFSQGVGEWRPEKNGSYGMFHVA